MNIKGYHKRSPEAVKRHIYDLPVDQPGSEDKPVMYKKSWNDSDDTMLRHYKSMDLTWEEIAENLERTVPGVKSRWHIINSRKEGSIFTYILSKLSNITSMILNFFAGLGNKERGK